MEGEKFFPRPLPVFARVHETSGEKEREEEFLHEIMYKVSLKLQPIFITALFLCEFFLDKNNVETLVVCEIQARKKQDVSQTVLRATG